MMAAIIDGVIIVLLIGSIAFGYLVSRKVRLLTATLQDLEPLVVAFSTAVDKSELSVAHLRESIVEVERQDEAAVANTEAEPTPSFRGGARFGQNARSGVRTVRDKQELVRAFFDTAETARA